MDRLESINTKMPEGVSPISALWSECMWGVEKVRVEDTKTDETAVTADKELLVRLFEHPYK